MFFRGKTLGVSHRGEKVLEKRSNFQNFGTHSGRFDQYFVQILLDFKHFWQKTSHGTVQRLNLTKIELFFLEKLRFSSIFDGKLPTVLWIVKIWPKLNLFFFLENLRFSLAWRKGSEKKVQFLEFWYAQWEI